jgi:hypothetical protein
MIHTITVSDLIWFRPTTQKMKALTKKKDMIAPTTDMPFVIQLT